MDSPRMMPFRVRIAQPVSSQLLSIPKIKGRCRSSADAYVRLAWMFSDRSESAVTFLNIIPYVRSTCCLFTLHEFVAVNFTAYLFLRLKLNEQNERGTAS